MELEIIILSEVSQIQKAKGCMFSLICERQIQYKYKHNHISYKYIQSIFLKVGLLEETKGGGKEGQNDRM
jgi:hypothetical protein